MSLMHVDAAYAELVQEIGLDAQSIFADPRIKVWRSLPDRENATLDHQRKDGTPVRLHIKRYPASAGFTAQREIEGFRLLQEANIPAAPIIAHGSLIDGRSFIILQDLAGYTPADKLIAQGFPFDRLLNPTADLAAKLHDHRLHHRDLYLCHFMIKPGEETADAKLIDMARVAKLNHFLTRRRWIVKDLGQFWYSTQSLPITEEHRNAWLTRYCTQRKIAGQKWIAPILRRATAIARHDKILRQKQPGRNVSIDGDVEK